MCDKSKYSKKEALTIINKIQRHEHRKDKHGVVHCKMKEYKWRKEKRIYQCAECNAWHLTSMEEEDYEQYMDDSGYPLWTPEHSSWSVVVGR